MKRFGYICADPGIPVPGTKGASIHVASVCRALTRAGMEGEILASRPTQNVVEGLSVSSLPAPLRTRLNGADNEVGRILAGRMAVPDFQGPVDFVYERYSLWHTGGLVRARELGVPFILEVNSPLPDEHARFRGLKNPELARGIARFLLAEADVVVCVSQEVFDWVALLTGRTERVIVVPNGVDSERFRPRPDSRPEPLPASETPLVAFSGSFRPWHGLDDLLSAFEQVVSGPFPDAHLVCVGDGPERSAFEQRSKSIGLGERVHLPGRVSHEEVPKWLAGAQVAVAPYPQGIPFYFSPLKVFEFMALALPVVGTDTGQLRELLGHGERGRLCPPGDVSALAREVADLLAHPEEARRLGDAGRKWVLENATWDRRVGKILEAIELVK